MREFWSKDWVRWTFIGLVALLLVIGVNLVLGAIVSFGVQMVISGLFGFILGWFFVPAAARALDLYPFV